MDYLDFQRLEKTKKELQELKKELSDCIEYLPMDFGIHTILTYHCCFMDGMLMPDILQAIRKLLT